MRTRERVDLGLGGLGDKGQDLVRTWGREGGSREMKRERVCFEEGDGSALTEVTVLCL